MFVDLFWKPFFIDFSMDVEVDLGICFEHFCVEADFMKIVPEPLREPRSGQKSHFFVVCV